MNFHRIIFFSVMAGVSLVIVVALAFGLYGAYLLVSVAGRGLNPI